MRGAAAAALPELTAQYRDYVGYQRALLDGGELLDWWTGYLSGAPDLLTVPGDRPRPTVRGIAGATRVFQLPAALMADVAALGGRMRMSPFMVLLGAYSALLGRLTGAADLLVGMPVTDRPEPEFEPLIGLFVDTLPVRVRTSAGQTFGSVLEGVRRSALDVLSHQGVSFDQLVERVRPDRLPSHTPLVQVAFSADLAPMARPRFADLSAELRLPEPTTAKFDLDLSINAASDGRRLCRGAQLQHRAVRPGHRRPLRGAVRPLPDRRCGPELPLHALPLLGERERALILDEWSRPEPVSGAEERVHEMFAARPPPRPRPRQ
ncbi:hypothetical protein GXW82_26175 [Streptacidiphilus sp. 4-A2]|nr:hypothetical protein [Streptacidiphilus sp. 4-A2]